MAWTPATVYSHEPAGVDFKVKYSTLAQWLMALAQNPHDLGPQSKYSGGPGTAASAHEIVDLPLSGNLALMTP